MVEAVVVPQDHLKTCSCGRRVVTLFDDNARATDGADGVCLTCLMRGNFEHMGTVGIPRRGDGKRTVVAGASVRTR